MTRPGQTYDPVSSLEGFIRNLAVHLDSDYGDWMREANLAWHELYLALLPHSPILEQQLRDLHDIIQYRPSWLPLETFREVLMYVRQIQHDFGAPGTLDLHRYDVGWTESEYYPNQ